MSYQNKKISVAILGSTGSIGKTTLKILSKYRNFFNVDLLSCNNNHLIFNQIKQFLPKYVIVNNIDLLNRLKKTKFKKKIKFFKNSKELIKLKNIKFNKTILGISSINGLNYAFDFIKISNQLLIANKETIICGGNFFLKNAKKFNCQISSIDSEHYCLKTILQNTDYNKIDRFYLTASGGPFLNIKKKNFSKINVNTALKHPKWKMGKKISIDFATMINKALEVMEASILFNIHPSKIFIKIHEQSLVHSVIVLKNGLSFLIAHETSMSIPIRNSLFDNNYFRQTNNFFYNKKKFIFSFNETDLKKFNVLKLGYRVLQYGPRGCIVFNVINDYLVHLYLQKKIFFYQITSKLISIFNKNYVIRYSKLKIKSKTDIFNTINYAKKISKLL